MVQSEKKAGHQGRVHLGQCWSGEDLPDGPVL